MDNLTKKVTVLFALLQFYYDSIGRILRAVNIFK